MVIISKSYNKFGTVINEVRNNLMSEETFESNIVFFSGAVMLNNAATYWIKVK